MTQQLQEYIYASEDFREKSEKLAQSIEINSVLLSDSSAEKAGQRRRGGGEVTEKAEGRGEEGGGIAPLEGGDDAHNDRGEEGGQPPEADMVDHQKLEQQQKGGGKGVDDPFDNIVAFGQEGNTTFGVRLGDEGCQGTVGRRTIPARGTPHP